MPGEQDWTTACQALFPDLNPFPVIETDEAGTITYCNPAARNQFPGLENGASEHPLTRNIRATIERYRRDGAASQVHEARMSERIYEQHVAYIKQRRTTHSYIFEITERKQAEEALLREKQQLEVMLKSMVNREERVLELKQEVNVLLKELGRNGKYGV